MRSFDWRVAALSLLVIGLTAAPLGAALADERGDPNPLLSEPREPTVPRPRDCVDPLEMLAWGNLDPQMIADMLDRRQQWDDYDFAKWLHDLKRAGCL
jgi:hypothetical protein